MKIKSKTVAGIIRREMDRFGVTKDALAKHIGVTGKTIYRLMNNKCDLTAEMAWKLSQAFGLNVVKLLDAQRIADIKRLSKFKKIRKLKVR